MNDVLTEAGLILGKPIPANDLEAWNLLWETDKLRYRASMASSEAAQALSNRKLVVLHPKDASVTDLDRNVLLEAGCAEQQLLVNRLIRVEDLLDKRVELLQAYVAYLSVAVNTEHKEDN